jgi:hypothetical protein
MPSNLASWRGLTSDVDPLYTAKGSRIGTNPASQSLGRDNQFRWLVCWRFSSQGVETRLSGFHQGLAWGGEEEMRHGIDNALFQPWKVAETDGAATLGTTKGPQSVETDLLSQLLTSIHFR